MCEHVQTCSEGMSYLALWLKKARPRTPFAVESTQSTLVQLYILHPGVGVWIHHSDIFSAHWAGKAGDVDERREGWLVGLQGASLLARLSGAAAKGGTTVLETSLDILRWPALLMRYEAMLLECAAYDSEACRVNPAEHGAIGAERDGMCGHVDSVRFVEPVLSLQGGLQATLTTQLMSRSLDRSCLTENVSPRVSNRAC